MSYTVGRDFEAMKHFAFSEPARHTETNITLVSSPANRDGDVETMAAELPGSWTELAIDLQVPTAWSAVRVRAFTMGDTGAQLAVEWAGADIPYSTADAGVLRARLRVSGELSLGWRVCFVDDATPPAGVATVELIAWNGSAPPVVSPEPAATRTTSAVVGTHTVADGVPDPTDAINASAFLMGWNDASTTNYQLRVDGNGFAFVYLTAGNVEDPAGSPDDFGFQLSCNNQGALYVLSALPDPNAPTPHEVATWRRTTAVRDAAPAGKTALLGVTFNNADVTGFYACIVDKASAPVGGDAIVASWWVPANAVVSRDLAHDIRLANGLGFCASSTANVVTLIGALVGSLEVQYAQ